MGVLLCCVTRDENEYVPLEKRILDPEIVTIPMNLCEAPDYSTVSYDFSATCGEISLD